MEKSFGRRIFTGAFSVVFFLCILLWAATVYAGAIWPEYREGEVLVKMKPETGLAASVVPASDIEWMTMKLGVAKARQLKSNHVAPGLYALRLKPGEKVLDKIQELKSNPDVEYAQPNYIYHATQGTNDTDFPQLWGLNNSGQAVNGDPAGIPGADIHAEDAWNTTTGSSNVIVAVVDTGIDYTHPDLIPNLWVNPLEGADGYTNDKYGINAITESGDPMDDDGHGTHVSGTIGAAGDNNLGVVGVNWNVKIMALKFLDSTGSGSDADAIECIDYAVAHADEGVKVINASWGGNPGQGDDPALETAIKSAGDAGILFVAAAGNEKNNNDSKPEYPASSKQPNVISVAATDNTDKLAWFSNYGSTSVDVAAPGVDILSTFPTTAVYMNTKEGVSDYQGTPYAFLSGTSMATPHVSGLAALTCAAAEGAGKELTAQEVKDLIIESVDPLGLPLVSKGRINAYNTVQNALNDWQITFDVQQDGPAAVYSAAPAVNGNPQYGKTVTFYRDGISIGTALTGSATSANPGIAVKRIAEPVPVSHAAYAVSSAYTGVPSMQSATVNYTISPPAITGVSPSAASGGSVVTLTGSNFGSQKGYVFITTPAGTQIKKAPLTWTDTAATFVLPKKAAGNYGVYVKNKTMASNTSSITIPLPAISSLSQTTATAATAVTITGNYFGASKGRVVLAPAAGGTSVSLSPTAWSDTSITFTVPAKPAVAYNLSVKNTAGTSAPTGFTITK